MAQVTFNNGIAYAKRASCANIDACNAVGVAQSAVLTNGTLVTLGGMGVAPAATGMGYVYNVTPTTGATQPDVWMVVTPAVPTDSIDNIYIDPRAYAAPAGRPVDIVRPMAGTDVFHVSKAVFGSNQVPDATTNKYVCAAANGQMKAGATATAAGGTTGIVFLCIGVEKIPVGQEFVDGYILKCIQNPLPAIS